MRAQLQSSIFDLIIIQINQIVQLVWRFLSKLYHSFQENVQFKKTNKIPDKEVRKESD